MSVGIKFKDLSEVPDYELHGYTKEEWVGWMLFQWHTNDKRSEHFFHYEDDEE